MRLVLHPKVYSDINGDNGLLRARCDSRARGGVLHRASLFHDQGRRQARIFFNPSVISGERICGGSHITFCSASLATKSEFSSSAITIDIHLLDPGVDRSMAELGVCRLEWSWILIGTSGGGGEDFESGQASQNVSDS